MKRISVLIVVSFLAFFLISCTTFNQTKFVGIDYQKEVEKGKAIDAIAKVLLNNGFDIENINENYGMITTGWKDLHTEGKNIGLTLLTGSRASSTIYSDGLKLTFQLTEFGYKVYPKQMRIGNTSNFLAKSSSSNEVKFSEKSIAGKLTIKVINQINALLGQSSQIQWGEE